MKLIDFNDSTIKLVLPLLLTDKTTNNNILWATDSYLYPADSEIQINQLNNDIIKPRVQKAFESQNDRTKSFAEVFTPSWICNKMNNYADECWFSRKNIFNTEQDQTWIRNDNSISFSNTKPWIKYVYSPRLEITCGEAPFIVSRYDAASGEIIPIDNRIGILDRKLRVVNENVDNEKDWVNWVYRAFQSTYGYEFQGDNLLIARINLLMTFVECIQNKWNRQPMENELKTISNIIVWNIWQMNGFTNSIPFREPTESQLDLFADIDEIDNDCLIYDWCGGNHPIKYRNLKGGNINMKFDFVLGNPPYQLETENETDNGQKRSKSIFHLFQQEADTISTSGTVLIYPGGRWIQQSGRGVAQFGKKQLNDPKLQKIIFYPDAKQLFRDADIADGISIVLKKMDKKSNVFDYVYVDHDKSETYILTAPGDEILPLNPKFLGTIKKINVGVKANNLGYLNNAILSQKLFGIESDFVEKNPKAVKIYEGQLLKNSEVKLFTNDKAGKAGRAKWYITNISNIPKGREYLEKYKVVVSSANAGGQKRDNQLEIVDNHSAFGRSRVALKTFDTLSEAEHFYNYCKSYFIRFAFLLTDEALVTVGKLVPDFFDYSNNNKMLNFNSDLDQQLFKLFNISAEEQKMIKDTVNNLRKT